MTLNKEKANKHQEIYTCRSIDPDKNPLLNFTGGMGL
jgi:hypothetical protein